MTGRRAPALRRTWLFGPGADGAAHRAMTQSGADALIQDLEDFTPAARRPEARGLAPALFHQWRAAGAVVCVRINPLEGENRVLVDGLWIEVPTYLNATRLLERAAQLAQSAGRGER